MSDWAFSHVRDVRGLLDRPAAVVGCSLGGRVALELVERLLLVGSALSGWDWPEIPETGRCVIEGAAHLPSLERPDELNRLLLESLA